MLSWYNRVMSQYQKPSRFLWLREISLTIGLVLIFGSMSPPPFPEWSRWVGTLIVVAYFIFSIRESKSIIRESKSIIQSARGVQDAGGSNKKSPDSTPDPDTTSDSK